MLFYVVRRLVWGLVSIVVLTFTTYVIFFQIPADPARFLVRNPNPTERQLAEAREYLGVDDPVLVQYPRFVWRALHLDFGVTYQSLASGSPTPVTTLIEQAAPVTASLFFGGMIIFLSISIPIGIAAALRPRSLFDRTTLAATVIGISLPPFLVALLLQQFFANRWALLPGAGYCPIRADPAAGCGGVVDWASHLILPWLSFALLFVALYSRMVRASVMEVLDARWVQAARAKGASEQRILRVHVLRNSLLPIVTMVGMDLGVAFASAVFIERVFDLPGLGSLAASAATGEVGFDLPVLIGVVIVVSVTVVIFNLVVDLMYPWLDPRITFS